MLTSATLIGSALGIVGWSYVCSISPFMHACTVATSMVIMVAILLFIVYKLVYSMYADCFNEDW